MPKNDPSNITLDLISKISVVVFLFLQLLHWVILPRFIDIYYHLLTAWGFIQAGGYSGWDFWQYAPVGRPHIYPPLFHLALAGFIKAGISPVILAKLCEALIPTLFLAILWKFIKDNYSSKLAFFAVLVFFSSFSFYLSLLNHIPATLALILGILSLSQLFKESVLRSIILLSLCFYTHIGISWFFALTFIGYGLLNREARRSVLVVSGSALIFASPIIIKELSTLRFVTALGLSLHENYLSQIKIAETALGLIGLFQALKMGKSYKLFAAMFFSSLIFLIYPYRFLSAEGYFPIILLAALCLFNLSQKINHRYLIPVISLFILVLSPTFSMEKESRVSNSVYKIKMGDSGFLNILLARGPVLWFPKEYILAAGLVKDNSGPKDITYATLDSPGLTIACLAGRASANGLLPEIKILDSFNPLAVAKIIVFTRIDEGGIMDLAVKRLGLVKLGENKLFIVYKNPGCSAQVNIDKSSLPFWLILGLALGVLIAYWQAGRVEERLHKFVKICKKYLT